ncbi:transcription termination/antitermination protein NusG [Chitinophaga varians]|uniref:transcription termination/antitermination protein NusG n=1 Tax=Chitinophaga varians TaxID=2202339 RepID=UPI00165F4A7B|nr:UpxY family transcription antiterminator [Chitinophaga varians]MBC9913409.1 UpxY family transcription antiterminator [Chitinophaga varians]
MNNFNKGWYLLYTRPNREKKVALHLDKRNVEFYLPIVKITKKWSDRKKTIEAPLFPSYVFTYLQSNRDYFDALGIEGAVQYVRIGKQIVRVDDTVVSNLKILLNSREELSVSQQYISAGEILHITEGPLAGLECEVVKYNGKDKIMVRVHLLNRAVLADLPLSYLARCSDIHYQY